MRARAVTRYDVLRAIARANEDAIQAVHDAAINGDPALPRLVRELSGAFFGERPPTEAEQLELDWERIKAALETPAERRRRLVCELFRRASNGGAR